MIIRYRKQIAFGLNSSEKFQELRKLNFYLGNRLVSNESIYVPSYVAALERFNELLINGQFQKFRTKNLTIEQSFERIINERNSDETQFFNHLFQLDETIDQYTIFVFQSGTLTEFVWTCWDDHNCNSEHKLNEIYSTRINTTELTSILKQMTNQLKNDLLII